MRSLILASALLVSSCTTAWISAYQNEQERKDAYRPDAPKKRAAPVVVTPVRTRVYVSRSFAASTTDWKKEIQNQFAAANEILASVDARFEIIEMKSWDHDGGERLETDLAILRRDGSDQGVDFVIGFVAGLPRFTNSVHDLGLAELAGTYSVARALDDAHELEAFQRGLQMTSTSEIQELYLARRRHKTAILLAHEWAHTVGAVHRADNPKFVMQPFYDAKRSEFAPANRSRIEIALAERVGPTGNEARWREQLVRELTNSPSDPQSTALLKRLESGSTTPVTQDDPWAALDDTERARLTAVFNHFNGQRYGEAWAAFSPVREKHRDDPQVQVLACSLSSRVPELDSKTICELAFAMAPTDPSPALTLLTSKTGRDAREQDQRKLLQRVCDTASSVPDHRVPWAVEVLSSHGALTCASALASRAADDVRPELDAAIDQTRNYYGLSPAGSREDEIAWVYAAKRIEEALAGKQFSTAENLARQGTERYAFSGPETALCETYSRSSRYAKARPLCSSALRKNEKDARAAYIQAVIELRSGRSATAKKLLTTATAHAPKFEGPWQLLANVLQSEGRNNELGELRNRYKNTVGGDPGF